MVAIRKPATSWLVLLLRNRESRTVVLAMRYRSTHEARVWYLSCIAGALQGID